MYGHFLGPVKGPGAPIRGGRPPMSPLQALDRGAPGRHNILVVYYGGTQVPLFPAIMKGCVWALRLNLGPLAHFQDL